MKRDMDYVRGLLLKIESAPRQPRKPRSYELLPQKATDEAKDKLAYHLDMLVNDVGFLKGINANTTTSREWIELELSWNGLEFLDSVRDPEIWRKTKVREPTAESLHWLDSGYLPCPERPCTMAGLVV